MKYKELAEKINNFTEEQKNDEVEFYIYDHAYAAFAHEDYFTLEIAAENADCITSLNIEPKPTLNKYYIMLWR